MVAKRRWSTLAHSNLSNYAFPWSRYAPLWDLFRIEFWNIIARTGNVRKLRSNVELGYLWWQYCHARWLSYRFPVVYWPWISLSRRTSRNRKARSLRTSQIRGGKKARRISQIKLIGSWRIIIKRGGRQIFRLPTQCRLVISNSRRFRSRGCRRRYWWLITGMDWRELVDLCSRWLGPCFHLYRHVLLT